MSSSPAAPRRYGGKTAEQRRTERRTALVDAALGIWQEQGWAAVTMRGVCARANLTDRYFYENFTNRDELLATAWDQVRDETLRAVLDTIAEHAESPPMDQLRAGLTVIVHRVEEDPARAQILYGDHSGSAILEQRRRQSVQQATDILIDLARPFLRAEVDEFAFHTAVLLGIGGFVEIMLAWRSGMLEAGPTTLIDHLTEISQSLAQRFLRPE